MCGRLEECGSPRDYGCFLGLLLGLWFGEIYWFLVLVLVPESSLCGSLGMVASRLPSHRYRIEVWDDDACHLGMLWSFGHWIVYRRPFLMVLVWGSFLCG